MSIRKHINSGYELHGYCGTPTYQTWESMVARCTNPGHNSYAAYGAVGIRVCDRWLDFRNFLADMGERPAGKTLDRYPNRSGNYEPTNCRWATPAEQARNRRDNRLLTLNGETMCLEDWARRLGVRAGVIRSRLDNFGWPVAKALTTPALMFGAKAKGTGKPKPPPRRFITDAIALEMRRERAAGLSFKALSTKYGFHTRAIWRAVRRVAPDAGDKIVGHFSLVALGFVIAIVLGASA